MIYQAKDVACLLESKAQDIARLVDVVSGECLGRDVNELIERVATVMAAAVELNNMVYYLLGTRLPEDVVESYRVDAALVTDAVRLATEIGDRVRLLSSHAVVCGANDLAKAKREGRVG